MVNLNGAYGQAHGYSASNSLPPKAQTNTFHSNNVRGQVEERFNFRLVDLSDAMNPHAMKGDVAKVEEIYNKFLLVYPLLKPNTVVYNVRIKAYSIKKRMDDALKLFQEMEEKNIPADIITYNSLITGLCKIKRTEEALGFFQNLPANVKPDIVTYNAMIDGLCKEGKARIVIKFIQMMQADEMRPDIFTYNSLAHALCKVGKIMETIPLFQMMQTENIEPDIVTYTTLMYGFCKLGEPEKAVELLKNMPASIKPNIITYNTLFVGFCKLGKVEEAFDLLLTMPSNIKCSVMTYSTFVEALELTRKSGNTLHSNTAGDSRFTVFEQNK